MPAIHPIQADEREHRDVATTGTRRRRRVTDEWTVVEFRPARWVLTALTLLALWLVGPKVGKRGLLRLAWQFAPRRLRLIAGGVAALALVVLVGSIAGLALALTHLA